MRWRKRWPWCLLLLLGVVALGPPAVRAEQVPFRHYTSAHGLPHEEVLAVAQGPDGRLWIGTRTGLAVFDGERIAPVPLPEEIGAAAVDHIAPGPDGSLWCAVRRRGVVQVRSGRVLRRLLPGEAVQRILMKGETTLFVTRQALWTLPPDAAEPQRTAYRYTLSPERARQVPSWDVGVVDADFDGTGQLWVLDGQFGVGRYRADGSVQFVGGPVARRQRTWVGLRFTGQGAAVVAREHRIYRLNPTADRLVPIHRLPDQDVNVRALYADGATVHVLTSAGLMEHAAASGRYRMRFDRRRGLPSDYLLSVTRDHQGGLWLGTRKGLVHLYAPAVRHVETLQGRPLNNLGNFRRGRDGTVWLSSYGNGLIRIAPDPARTAPDGAMRWGLLPRSADGHVHALGASGWYRYDGDSWQQMEAHQGAVYGFVQADGTALFTHNNGLYYHDPEAGRPPVPLLRWPAFERWYYAVAPAPEGGVVIRSRDALLRGRLTAGAEPVLALDTLARLPGFAEAVARHMAVDTRRRVWMPVAGRGLLLVDPARAVPDRDTAKPAGSPYRRLLPGRTVRRVILAGDSLAYVRSQEGLFILNQADGQLLHHLTQADGLLSNNTESALLLGDTLYVSHVIGLTKLPRSALTRPEEAPRTLLTQVTRRDVAVTPDADTSFTADDREVQFTFAAPYFRQPERVRYEYRLLPGEQAWRATDAPVVRYTNLGPGEHRFEVRARLGGGAPGIPARYTFAIPPYIYETTWFAVLCGVALVGLVVGAYRWRVHRLRERQRHLEAVVTERTRDLRAEKRKTEAQARRLSELDAAKSRFFANLSHEFRTPLTLITAPIEEELRGAEDPERQQRLGLVLRNARRLLRLVDQLLDLAKLESGAMTLQRARGDLTAFVAEGVRAFQPLAEREGIALQVRTPPEPLHLAFDPDALDKVVGNLVANALKFTPAGGKVWVTVSAPGDDHPDRADPPIAAEIVVKDTGPGIPPDVLPHVFDRFQQGDPSATRPHEGTGIGLALARELVDLHGGRITVESEPGFGSAFTVQLPAGQPAEGEAADAPSLRHPRADDGWDGPADGDVERQEGPEPPAREDALTVLVIEDHDEVRRLVRSYLEAQYRVLDAPDGRAGLDAARRHHPDLILADVMMPEMDGLALVQAVRADDDLQDVPVLLLTARADADDVVRGLEAGADDYVTKPFDAEVLQARVRRHLATRQALRDQYRGEVMLQPQGVPVSSAEEAFLRDVVAAVEAHLDESDFGVGDLAAAVGLSARQLRRRLKDAAGETPQAFIRRVRLERAAHLLTAEAGTASEIAYRVGFKNPSHFSRAFRKHFGHTPTEHGEQ
ncbi:MAG: response regulator [Bacteroidetes bacterium]|jgi:signal transduction histidine kinase/DNA-binding response OmpR family regulator|nr:response regulator [Bacteroidota bacterium]